MWFRGGGGGGLGFFPKRFVPQITVLKGRPTGKFEVFSLNEYLLFQNEIDCSDCLLQSGELKDICFKIKPEIHIKLLDCRSWFKK